jgi:hypothetical protein
MTENHCQVGLGHDHGSKNQDFHRHASSVFRLAWVVGPAETELAGMHRLDCTQQRRRHAPSAFRSAWVVDPAETELAGMHRLDCTQQRRRHVYYMWPLRQYIMSLNHKTGVPLDLAIR